MKALILLGDLVLGGAERQALLLAEYLTEHYRAEVVAWGLFGTGNAIEACEQSGVRWRDLGVRPGHGLLRNWRNLVVVARELRQARPDVVLPYCHVPNVYAGIAWRGAGADTCIWNQRDEGLHRLHPWFERMAIRRTPLFIANAPRAAEFLVDEMGVSRSRVQLIHNGVKLSTPEADRASWRARIGVPESSFLACMVANLTSESKDHTTLLRAWRLVTNHVGGGGARAVLLLAGHFSGAEKALVALAEQLALGDAVRFMGPVRDIPGLLQAVDLCVFSSRTEGCPNGVLEAMAAGLAVAGTDIHGIRFAVGSEGCRFLAPVGNAEVLADHILYLLEHTEERRSFGATNATRIRREFDSARMCAETTETILRGLRAAGAGLGNRG